MRALFHSSYPPRQGENRTVLHHERRLHTCNHRQHRFQKSKLSRQQAEIDRLKKQPAASDQTLFTTPTAREIVGKAHALLEQLSKSVDSKYQPIHCSPKPTGSWCSWSPAGYPPVRPAPCQGAAGRRCTAAGKLLGPAAGVRSIPSDPGEQAHRARGSPDPVTPRQRAVRAPGA